MTGYILSTAWIVIVAFILLAATGADAQERGRVLDCLGEIDAPWYDDLHDLEGENIYIGGAERFDVPGDVHMIAKLKADSVIVWIFYAYSTPGITYWFPFSDTTLYENGRVMHPCGAFRVIGSGGL